MNLERTPGYYKLDSVELYSYVTKENMEIMDLVAELNIHEDMFNNTLSANIILEDTWNIIGRFPVVGHELITISLDTPEAENELILEFRVYKIDNYEKSSDRASVYTIQLISAEYLLNLGTTISKSYPDSLTSEVVRNIFDEMYLMEFDMSGKVVDIEPTQNVHDIWIPNWKPFDAINWLASKSVPESKMGSNYVFYENRDGFNFKSIETLADVDEPIATYYHGSKNTTQERNSAVNVKDKHLLLNSYSVEHTFDIISNISMGMYASRVIYHDMLKRSYKVNDYNYVNNWPEHKHIGESMLVSGTENHDVFQNNSLSFQKVIPISTDASSLDDEAQARLSQLQQLNSFKLNVTLQGDVNRKIGDIIAVEIPSAEQVDTELVLDPFYSGRYLVTALRHIINSTGHNTSMELVKDSFFSKEILEG